MDEITFEGTVTVKRKIRRKRGLPYASEATGKIYYLLNFWNKMHFQTLIGNQFQPFLGYG
jgi:hypothetical protein